MDVIFLGSGTSQGVPMIACDCPVCSSPNPRDRRMRTSVHVVMDGLHVQVDAGPEFRMQCLRENIKWVDLFILTHGHSDHIAGMDDLRRFCDLLGAAALPVFSTAEGMVRVATIYPYAIGERPAATGYAAFRLREMPVSPEKLDLPQGTIEAALLPHGTLLTLGLVFTERSSGKKFAYYTDCKTVPPAAIDLAHDADVVVLDGLRPQPHPSHMSITEAVEMARHIGAPQTYLTHLTHLIGYGEWSAKMPQGVALAYDGLRVSL